MEKAGLLRLPYVPDDCLGNFHLFYLLLPDGAARDGLQAHLNARGIHAVFHYVPLHSSPMGQRYGYQAVDLPVTEEVSRRLLRLPLYHEMTETEQAEVIGEVQAWCRGRRGASGVVIPGVCEVVSHHE